MKANYTEQSQIYKGDGNTKKVAIQTEYNCSQIQSHATQLTQHSNSAEQSSSNHSANIPVPSTVSASPQEKAHAAHAKVAEALELLELEIKQEEGDQDRKSIDNLHEKIDNMKDSKGNPEYKEHIAESIASLLGSECEYSVSQKKFVILRLLEEIYEQYDPQARTTAIAEKAEQFFTGIIQEVYNSISEENDMQKLLGELYSVYLN